jgi:hypothetical protein
VRKRMRLKSEKQKRTVGGSIDARTSFCACSSFLKLIPALSYQYSIYLYKMTLHCVFSQSLKLNWARNYGRYLGGGREVCLLSFGVTGRTGLTDIVGVTGVTGLTGRLGAVVRDPVDFIFSFAAAATLSAASL